MSSFDFMAGIPISFALEWSQEKKIIILNIILGFEAIVMQSNQYQVISNSTKNTKTLIFK